MLIRGCAAVVTGASSGIGAATAVALACRGARAVVLLARTASALEEVAAEVRACGATSLPRAVDLADAAAVAEVAAAIQHEIGAPDLIVNGAGAGRFLFVEETSAADAAAMMAVPYLAAFHVTHAFLPAMLARGRGHIVNITSPAAFLPWPGATAYSAARWAVRGFTAALRADLHDTGIGVTLVVPGQTRTPYFERNPGSAERIPGVARIARTLEPEEVAVALVRAVERGSRQVVLPFGLRVALLAHRLLPRPTEWLVARTGARRG